MKIILTVIGKTSTDYLVKGIENYTKRIGHYIGFELKQLPDIKNVKGGDANRQKQLEGEMLLKEFSPGDFVMLLDERGKEMTSREFATFIDRKMSTLQRNLIFVVGGPYGFSQDVYNRADALLSLSKMTYPHELIRLFFVEQIYRAMTILRGEPYHHD